jgi:tyrosyl-tRNA synthetase
LLFSGSKEGVDLDNLSSLPQIVVPRTDVFPLESSGSAKAVTLLDLLLLADLAPSKAAARRLISAGGVRINDVRVQEGVSTAPAPAPAAAAAVQTALSDDDVANIHLVLGAECFDAQGKMKLSAGKKKHVVVILGDN